MVRRLAASRWLRLRPLRAKAACRRAYLSMLGVALLRAAIMAWYHGGVCLSVIGAMIYGREVFCALVASLAMARLLVMVPLKTGVLMVLLVVSVCH